MKNWAVYLTIPVMILLAALQTTFFAYLPIAGVTIQLVPIFVIAWALWQGSAETMIAAFLGGFIIDFLSVTPLGLSSCALLLALVAIIPFQMNWRNNRFIAPFLLSALAVVIFQLAHYLLLGIVGYRFLQEVVLYFPTSVVLHTLLVIPIYWLMLGVSATFGRKSELYY